jgi:hypothetical protein
MFYQNTLKTKNYLFNILIFLPSIFFLMPLSAVEKSSAPDKAMLYIISPQDGDTVSSPVKVIFGLNGMGVAPAGIKMKNTGHHHLLIDLAQLPDINLPIPSDDHHRHFGKGQTEAFIELDKGEHTLQLILGDHMHVPHEPPIISKKIRIKVN